MKQEIPFWLLTAIDYIIVSEEPADFDKILMVKIYLNWYDSVLAWKKRS